MTENEKLRMLLAEAQEWVPEAREWPSDPQCDLLERIDAALAEPPSQCQLCEVSKAFHDVAVKQRQLAWIEADRSLNEAAYWKGEFTRLHEQHLPVAFAGAYQRGAEAMREAAARCVVESARYWSAQYVADDIRALPVPEDR